MSAVSGGRDKHQKKRWKGSGPLGAPAALAQLEQEHTLAQVISAMPSNIDNGPDITIAAPIRAKWAHRLYQQGVRVHEDLATHKIVNYSSGVAGPHGPRAFQKIDKDKLLGMIQEQNPTLYQRLMDLQQDHHGGDATMDKMLQQVLERLPEDLVAKLKPMGDMANEFAEQNIPTEPPEPTVYQ